jgi:hypothetical protein
MAMSAIEPPVTRDVVNKAAKAAGQIGRGKPFQKDNVPVGNIKKFTFEKSAHVPAENMLISSSRADPDLRRLSSVTTTYLSRSQRSGIAKAKSNVPSGNNASFTLTTTRSLSQNWKYSR